MPTFESAVIAACLCGAVCYESEVQNTQQYLLIVKASSYRSVPAQDLIILCGHVWWSSTIYLYILSEYPVFYYDNVIQHDFNWMAQRWSDPSPKFDFFFCLCHFGKAKYIENSILKYLSD